jgi:hydroxymethylbilane synthase
MKARIATRKSPLALWQAEHVAELLRGVEPGLEVEIVKLTTRGDKILDQALSKVGGKDLFVKEIEEALLDSRADVAVHSLKDMPTELPRGLVIGAFPRREDPRDALVSPQRFMVKTLPQGAKIGTSSLRRAAQLLRRRPDLQIVPIRGNVQTRLKKVETEGLAGTLLALAGLKRLGMDSVVSEVLEVEQSLPAIGQGILAVEIREGDANVERLVRPLDDAPSRAAAVAERAFLAKLHGGCQVPIAGHARIEGSMLSMRGLVCSLDGREAYEDTISGAVTDAAKLGTQLADKLLEAGAGRVLESLAAAKD